MVACVAHALQHRTMVSQAPCKQQCVLPESTTELFVPGSLRKSMMVTCMITFVICRSKDGNLRAPF